MNKIPCLLALALFVPSLQYCKSEAAKSEPNATPATRNQTSSRSDSQQPNETVVPAPSMFSKVFVGTIDDKYAIRMVTHYDVDRAGIERALAATAEVIASRAPAAAAH